MGLLLWLSISRQPAQPISPAQVWAMTISPAAAALPSRPGYKKRRRGNARRLNVDYGGQFSRLCPHSIFLVSKLFSWTTEAAFRKLKSLFISAPVLVYSDPSRQFIVEVDASDTGIGAVLSQRSGEDQRVHPCAYFSRSYNPAEKNYDVGNK